MRGHRVLLDTIIGHLVVYHDGQISWETLQNIKSDVWGKNSRAVEVYPAETNVVNRVNARHLWLLGDGDFCPDLLGDPFVPDTLENRYRRGWDEASQSTTLN